MIVAVKQVEDIEEGWLFNVGGDQYHVTVALIVITMALAIPGTSPSLFSALFASARVGSFLRVVAHSSLSRFFTMVVAGDLGEH